MLGRDNKASVAVKNAVDDRSVARVKGTPGKKSEGRRLLVHPSGALVINPPLFIKRLALYLEKHRFARRVLSASLALLIIFSIFYTVFNDLFTELRYQLSPKAEALLITHGDYLFESKLTYSLEKNRYEYNTGYSPNQGEVAGQISGPQFSAIFNNNPRSGVQVTDPHTNTTIGIKPRFALHAPRKDSNRLEYPMVGFKGVKIITLGASGLKEDLILEEFIRDTIEFKYELDLPDYVEARLESNGSIGIYGPSNALLGDVATSTDSDAQLLEKARKNSEKTTLLFTLPTPYIRETGKRMATYEGTYFQLEGNALTLVATNLRDKSYPLSVDPTIYIETAAKLMRGNNETNTDFDVDNELIQKSQTTGARIDAWQGNLDMSEGVWGQSAAAAGGYVYRSGGQTGLTRPQIVSEQTTTDSTNSTSFQMSMPADRPAGDLYVAVMCHDNSGATVSPPAGWQEYADIGEFAAYWKIGTDEGGGNEAANYTWTISASEAKAGAIIRVTGFNAADPISGTPGTDSGGSGTPDFPAVTPDTDATLIIRAVGADNDVPTATGWVPSGHTKIASGNSGGTQDCSFMSASLDSSPAAGVAAPLVTTTELDDSWGGASIAINPDGSPLPPQVEDFQQSIQGSNSANFTMNMPATRPAGDLYIAVMCHDGTINVNPPAGGGWQEYADTSTREHAAYWKIGTDEGGGNEAASYTWTAASGSEIWAGAIIRISNFDSSDPISGTPGNGSNAANSTPVFPATTPDTNNTLIIRAAGADNDTPSATGWVPAGHTKIASGTPNVGGDCGYVAAFMDSSPVSGVSTGTATLGDTSLNDTWGASSIAINAAPAGSSTSTRASLNWAQFNSSTLAIESPNPGTGVCSGWCTDPTYDLPAGRRGHSMVAYNGYLYVIGGVDSSSSRVSTIYIAKFGANGEPQLWHPTDSDKSNWLYWYTDTGLNGGTAKSYMGAVAYNNRMYLIGGQTDASPSGITTVEMADILPNGRLSSWTTTGMQVLPGGAGRHMHGVHIYNNVLYSIGGFEGAATSSANLRNTVYYSRLNSDGTMNAWQQTNSFSTARANFGGSFSYIWGAYIYLGGGCSAVNGSGYCTTIAGDMQLASINADGTVDLWSSLGTLDNARIGHSLVGWQGGLYRIGGCTSQNPSNGDCTSTLSDVDYGVVNPAGEVSTVNITEASGVGTCNGGSPYNCDLPPTGDGAGQGGHMLSATTVLNGFLYAIGGCTNFACSQSSGNTSYVAIGSDGSLQRPTCPVGTYYGAWCVNSTNKINGNSGVSAPGVTVFNNRIYIIGGIDESATGTQTIYYNLTNSDGSLDGAWETSTFGAAGISGELAYTYAYARANPASAGTNPGNLFVFGGCNGLSASAGCTSGAYNTEVYKCNITTTGSVSGCTTTGQLQLDVELSTETNQGLGLHSGTVYANYIYLIGGYSVNVGDRATVFYAKFDDSNNVVDAESGTADPSNNDDDWIEANNTLSVGRRRGWAFGYNGHIYAVGGYDDSGTGIIPFIEWSKMNVSNGAIDSFVTSSVTINQRWGLSMAVSNSYAYVVGGCDVGASPGGCSSFEPSIQTFQLYNNNSGSVANFTAQADQTFTADTNRWGASSAIYTDPVTETSYLYVAGGCISTVADCSGAGGGNNTTNNVQYAVINPQDGSVGTWNNGGALPADRAWGSLEVVGGTLYYIGGHNDTQTNEQSTVYYTTSVTSGNPTWSGSAASNGLPAARARFGSTVWNDRIFIVGGVDGSANVTSTVYVSPQLSSGGNITSAWSSESGFDVARSGAAVTAYANNLYLFGGFTGSQYLSDSQFTQINSDGTLDAWTFTTSLPGPLRDSRAVSANGYIYLVGGRSAATTCAPKVLITPVTANTTIASGNNPTGIGEWYETNVRYSGDRYGAAAEYFNGKLYTMGGGCSTPLSSNRHFYSTINSQPQVAIYSRLIDTDSDVFPNSWLMNGLDNAIGARWRARYRSMNDTDGIPTDCGSADMSTWGQETVYGDVSLGDVAPYSALDASGNNIGCARYFYFFVSIDASKTFGYPEDVNRGPTISDLSLFFTSDPNKRLRHGKTFTGGELQPLDTPCRQDEDPDCPLPPN